MNDDAFNAIKEAEKERLRVKKHRARLQRAKKQSASAVRMVQAMQQEANDLLDEAVSLTDRLMREVAQHTARAERAEDAAAKNAPEASLEADEEVLREARAVEQIRQMKQATESIRSGGSSDDDTDDDTDASSPASPAHDSRPEKTIGPYR